MLFISYYIIGNVLLLIKKITDRIMGKRYLTVDVCKKHLNIDADFVADDGYISDLIDVAQNVVAIHIGRNLEDCEDENGYLAPGLIHAMLLLIGTFYANRESVVYLTTHQLPHGYEYLLELFTNYEVYG